MTSSGRRISQVMRQISQNQNAPGGSGFGMPSPIARGLSRAGDIANINSSQPNRAGFSQLLSSLQILRQMPMLQGNDFSSLLKQSQNLPLRSDLPEPDLSEFDTDDEPDDADD